MIITHVLVDNDGAVLRTFHGPADFQVGDTQYGRDVFERWTPAERAVIGLLDVDLDEVPHDPATQDHGAWALVHEEGRWLCRNAPVALSAETLADRLATAKAIKAAELTGACAATIRAGVEHDALGTVHTYPMGDTDQTNLLGRIAQAQMDPAGSYALWCADGGGVWAKRPHTSAQTIAVGLAAAQWVQLNSDRLSGEDGQGGLLKAVADAQSVAEVAAITWA